MKDEQLERLIASLDSQQKKSRGGDALEVITKILIWVCTTGVFIVGGFLISMNTNMALFAQSQGQMKDQFDEIREDLDERDKVFEEFAAKPRWTESQDDKDDEELVKPIHIELKQINSKIDDINIKQKDRIDRFEEIEDRILGVERELDYMERDRE